MKHLKNNSLIKFYIEFKKNDIKSKIIILLTVMNGFIFEQVFEIIIILFILNSI
jgi:hypothetical protein